MENLLIVLLVISWSFIVYKCVKLLLANKKGSTHSKQKISCKKTSNTVAHWDPTTESYVSSTGYSYSLKDQGIVYPNQCGLSESEKLGFDN